MFESVTQNLPGALVTLLLLGSAHLLLWNRRSALWRVAAYVIGCACIAAGMAVTALIAQDASALRTYLAHLVPGGIVIVLAWSLRGWQAARQQAHQDAASLEEAARHAERTY